ncbi:MAG: acyltransferase [Bacteroidales bacterium]|nr:acyltransferase [Bacteroidales bacterium]
MTKTTDSRFDILKFILALLILILHTTLYPEIFRPWVRSAVPVFFIISSYFFFRPVYASAYGSHGRFSHYVKRSVVLYFFWFAILIIPTCRIYHYFSAGVLEGLWKISFNIFFGGTFPASWFISACVIGISIVYAARRHLRIMTVAALLCYLICCSLTNYFKLLPSFNEWFVHTFPIWNPANSFPASLLWICAGAIIARRENEDKPLFRLPVNLVLMVAGFILLWLEHRYICANRWERTDDCYLSLIVVAPALFMAILSLPGVSFSWTILLRHASVIIYCLHATIARLLFIHFKEVRILQPESGVYNFAITLLSVALASTLILILQRRKFFSWLRFSY